MSTNSKRWPSKKRHSISEERSKRLPLKSNRSSRRDSKPPSGITRGSNKHRLISLRKKRTHFLPFCWERRRMFILRTPTTTLLSTELSTSSQRQSQTSLEIWILSKEWEESKILTLMRLVERIERALILLGHSNRLSLWRTVKSVEIFPKQRQMAK